MLRTEEQHMKHSETNYNLSTGSISLPLILNIILLFLNQRDASTIATI